MSDIIDPWTLDAFIDKAPGWRELCGLPIPTEPQPPASARIIYPNGKSIDCPLRYMGYKKFHDRDLFPHHGWQMLNEGPFDGRRGDTIDIDWTGATMPCYVQCPGTGTPDA